MSASTLRRDSMCLEIWNKLNKPPENALKKIAGGRLSGKTDISPQWRYKAMTEAFGPCGVGWKFTVDKKWTEQGNDCQMFAFVDVSLYIKQDGVWSEAIPGTGGAMLIEKEKSGLHSNDEAFKMATTDALSVAMKMIGVAAEIYLGNWDGSKYINQDKPKEEKKEEDIPEKLGEAPKEEYPEFDNTQAIKELKKKLNAMMKGFNPEQKVDFFGFVLGGNVTVDSLQEFIDKYDEYRTQFMKARA